MPVKNDPAALRTLVAQKLANKVLSQTEANAIAKEALKDGFTAEEGQALVAALTGAIASDGIDLSSATKQATLNALLGKLDKVTPLPIDRTGAETLPAGGVNFAKLLSMQATAKPDPLAKPTLSGNALAVDKKGELSVGVRRQTLDLAHPAGQLVEALWGLALPGQTAKLPEASARALQANLAAGLKTALAVPQQDPDKFNRGAAICAATAALGEVAAQWTPETADAVLELAEKTASPMTKALALRALNGAKLTEAQAARRAAISAVEGGADLLAAFDKARAGTAKAGYTDVKGPAAEMLLSALAFAKNGEAVTNFLETMKAWDQLNPGWNQGLDAEEMGHLRKVMEAYAQGSEQAAFVFGTLKGDAPKDCAAIVSQRTFQEIEPELKSDKPSLYGYPLTRDQADFVLGIAPNLKDKAAVEKLVRCLGTAQAVFSESMPNQWTNPATPSKTMDPAAFALFARAATDYQDRLDAQPDGKLGYADLLTELSAEVKDLRGAVTPRLAELKKSPPTWEGVKLSPEAATYLEGQLRNHLKSSMSVDNLGRGLKVFAAKTGGSVQGADFAKFKAMVEEYKAAWPKLQTFDFNKLERIAAFKVEGKEVPLCTLNGQKVGLADFYDTVATSVAKAFDPKALKLPWMADRWGYRAKQLVELMDVVAEQTARGEGPVALLAKENPGKRIEILATGADGGHAQLLYSVKDANGRELSRWAQGSDGALGRTTESVEPVLVTATVGKDGDLNATVNQKIDTRRYPLQNPYTVGDKVDISFQDAKVEELAVEGKPFSTRWKVLEATITGYDAKGNYTVKYKTPAGEEKTETVPLSTLRKANNPHYFNPAGSSFSDVSINVNTDQALKDFLAGAQPIIDAHLAPGTTATLSPKELARRQKECIDELMHYAATKVKYPAEEAHATDPNSKAYYDLQKKGFLFPLGELAKIERGVCRHQCIFEHLLLQQAGIDSRLASGSANTSSNAFRGYHIWTEVTLADNERYLSDQTWSDPYIPLWSGAYSVDRQRQEMYDRTARYDTAIVN